MMEIVEVIYTSKEIRDAANLILDQAILQTNGIGILQELGFAGEGGRLYVTDDSARLKKVIDRIGRGGRIYFLGHLNSEGDTHGAA